MSSTLLVACGIAIVVMVLAVILLLPDDFDPEADYSDLDDADDDEGEDHTTNSSSGLGFDNQGDPVLKLGGNLGLDLTDSSVGINVGGIFIDTDGK